MKHETLVAATVALEAGATNEMLDMVLNLGKEPNNVEELGTILADRYHLTVSDTVKHTLFAFRRAVTRDNTDTKKSVIIGMSEARRDEFYLRRASGLPRIRTHPS